MCVVMLLLKIGVDEEVRYVIDDDTLLMTTQRIYKRLPNTMLGADCLLLLQFVFFFVSRAVMYDIFDGAPDLRCRRVSSRPMERMLDARCPAKT